MPEKTTTRTRRTPKDAPTPEPVVDVTLDLDTAEREGGPRKPFTCRVKGQIFTLQDPEEVDWKDLLTWDLNPAVAIRQALVDKVDEFFDTPMPGWQMKALQRAYLKHFGLPDPGNRGALPA